MDDPFSLVYRSLLEHLNNSAALADVNIVDLASTRDPEIGTPSAADLPELQLRPGGYSTTLGRSSCASEIVRSYDLLLDTGDQRLQALFDPITFGVIAAMYDIKYSSVLEALTWNGKSFITEVNLVDSTEELLDASDNRSHIRAWVSIANIQVMMYFDNADLVAHTQGTI